MNPQTADEPAGRSASVSPQRRLIGTRAELAAMVDEVLALRPRTVRIAAADGAPFQLGTPRVVDALLGLLRADRHARVRVLLDDAQWVEARAARLKHAQRLYPHALELRVASTDDPVGEDLHLLADALHSITVRAGRLVSGEVWLNNQPRAQPLVSAFDRRWDTAAHNLPVAPLGL